MPIPDYQTVMLPLLRLASDGAAHRFRDAVEALAHEFALSPTERLELLPSGTQPLFTNRVGWARTYLKQAGLLQSPQRGTFKITQSGRELIARNPERIDVRLLEGYEEFRRFRARRSGPTPPEATTADESLASTPEEEIQGAYLRLRSELEAELLERVRSNSPEFFERLVVDLLVAMGYGGSRRDAGRVTKRSGDEGIDGIIKEDRLGLDSIYIQAKRWKDQVGRPEIQRFVGALSGQRAKKGVFITTSGFSAEARDYAAQIETRVVLIDGEELARLMVDHNIGVGLQERYDVKRIDTDYFEEE